MGCAEDEAECDSGGNEQPPAPTRLTRQSALQRTET
jgi:hypothetical protein